MLKFVPPLILRFVISLRCGATAAVAQGILVPRGSVWKYFDQGIDLGTAWRGTGFGDGSWAAGPARLGYGGGGGRTLGGFGAGLKNKNITPSFCQSFSPSDAP